jgi:hypothetical protein
MAHQFLRSLVFEASYRSFLRTCLQRGIDVSRLCGVEVGFLDLAEADRYGVLFAAQYNSRSILGSPSLTELFSSSISKEPCDERTVISEFLESAEFSEVQHVPSTGSGIPLELGMYRFLQRRKFLRGVDKMEAYVLEHEYRRAIAMAITVVDDPAFSVKLPGFLPLPRLGQWSVLEAFSEESAGHATESEAPTKATLYYGGHQFVTGAVSGRIIEILTAATHLRSLDHNHRHAILLQLFDEERSISMLNQLGMI